jgi:hypothetical protein
MGGWELRPYTHLLSHCDHMTYLASKCWKGEGAEHPFPKRVGFKRIPSMGFFHT